MQAACADDSSVDDVILARLLQILGKDVSILDSVPEKTPKQLKSEQQHRWKRKKLLSDTLVQMHTDGYSAL